MNALAPEVLAYYERGDEDLRLRSGAGRLEFWRTQDVLRRVLPPRARVLDVGGGSGVHAQWLAQDGHQVELIDPVPLHVAQAAGLAGVSARLGHALELPFDAGTSDVVLLLGPLYHLIDRGERLRALAEARRVVREGGVVVAATINRYAPVHDTLRNARYFEPAVRARNDATVRSGEHRPAAADALFTTAYFHEPAEILAEVQDAGLDVTGQYGVEGAAWLMGDIDAWLDDPSRRADVLHAVRLTESASSLLGASAHLLTVARRTDP
ncbi:MAG TPA: class I SAM-dependent methyltransferase [Jatrophihabitantaceae bacterium]|jgi:SAM-dependent methyltransferase